MGHFYYTDGSIYNIYDDLQSQHFNIYAKYRAKGIYTKISWGAIALRLSVCLN